jgi:hypothetical protein
MGTGCSRRERRGRSAKDAFFFFGQPAASHNIFCEAGEDKDTGACEEDPYIVVSRQTFCSMMTHRAV